MQIARISTDPVASASAVSLNYSTDADEGIVRHRRGASFAYYTANGRPVRDRDTLARIRSLAIPPAWTHVWISPDPHGHIQATGRDARGRKQYRYHARWSQVRGELKFYRLVEFCHVLPRIRRAVGHDLHCKCLCKRKVIATIVSLMERAQLRVGNDEYTRQNGSYGATTLRNHHVKFKGATLSLSFRGKSGIERRIEVQDKQLAKIVRQCHDLPGRRLFEYIDCEGNVRPVTSMDVNEYIRDVSGGSFTAKDYRTWAATMSAALLLCTLDHPDSERACKRCVNDMLKTVAAKLGHTPSVCRKSYIHPQLIDDFMGDRLAGPLVRAVRRQFDGEISATALRAVEPAVARYLDTRRRRHA